jgi:hypothetical protein
MRVTWLGIVAVAAVMIAPGQARAQPASSREVSAVTHGLKVTLSVGRLRYPRNALVRARVTVANVSRHAILLSTNNAPWVGVYAATGSLVYDPRLPFGRDTFVFPKGPYRPPISLRAGASQTGRSMLILRGRVLRPTVAIVRARGFETSWTGPEIRLSLSPPDPPHVALVARPALRAVVSGTPRGRAVYAAEQIRCTLSSDGGSESTEQYWTPLHPPSWKMGLLSTCGAMPFHWMALIGALNHSVATVDRSQP